MKTLQETVDYIHKYITEYEKGEEPIEKEILYGMVEEGLLDTVEKILTEEEIKKIIDSDDNNYIDEILSQRISNYPALLDDIKNDILNEYVLGETE